jgi:hypothetical protein
VAVAVAVTSTVLRPARGGGWLLAGVLVIVGGLAAMVLVGARAEYQTSLAVLIALVGAGVWAGAVPVLGTRRALVCAVASLVLLNLIRLPVDNSLPYRWRQALYRPDQTVQASVTFDGTNFQAPALRVLAEPHLTSASPSFQVRTSTPLGTTTWSCPWRSGQQWLLLPLPSKPSGTLPVMLGVAGQPARDGDYVIVFGENEAGGFLIEPGDASQPDRATVCSAAS